MISMNTISFPVSITDTLRLNDQRKKAERDNVRTLLSYFKQYNLISIHIHQSKKIKETYRVALHSYDFDITFEGRAKKDLDQNNVIRDVSTFPRQLMKEISYIIID